MTTEDIDHGFPGRYSTIGTDMIISAITITTVIIAIILIIGITEKTAGESLQYKEDIMEQSELLRQAATELLCIIMNSAVKSGLFLAALKRDANALTYLSHQSDTPIMHLIE